MHEKTSFSFVCAFRGREKDDLVSNFVSNFVSHFGCSSVPFLGVKDRAEDGQTEPHSQDFKDSDGPKWRKGGGSSVRWGAHLASTTASTTASTAASSFCPLFIIIL